MDPNDPRFDAWWRDTVAQCFSEEDCEDEDDADRPVCMPLRMFLSIAERADRFEDLYYAAQRRIERDKAMAKVQFGLTLLAGLALGYIVWAR